VGDDVLISFGEFSLNAGNPAVGSFVVKTKAGFRLGAKEMRTSLPGSVGSYVGSNVGDLVVEGISFSVGRRDGCSVVGGLGSSVGCLVGFDVGRQFVNAMHFIVGSEHSVSCPDVHGSKQFLFTSAHEKPHQKECRISSAGITSLVGPSVVGFEVGGRGIVGDSVGEGDTVGGTVVGSSVGLKVGAFVGSTVISNALQDVPP